MNTRARLHIIAEGQTEETFVRDRLVVPLSLRTVDTSVRLVKTGRHRGVTSHGGMTTFARALGDIQKWLLEDQTAYLTTMFDLYGLPSDAPGWAATQKEPDPYRKVAILERSLGETIANRRFIPYIQLHEFEGLLFSDVVAIDDVLKTLSGVSQLRALWEIRAAFATPEAIDDDEKTAPSKRLLELYRGYDKVVFGSLISARIGLDVIRRECPHFHHWLSRLESLAGVGGP